MGLVMNAQVARAIPTHLRRMLRSQCNGEWERVTRDDDGGYTVHNNAAIAAKSAAETPRASRANTRPAPPPAPRPTPKVTLPEPGSAMDQAARRLTAVPRPSPEPRPAPQPQPKPVRRADKVAAWARDRRPEAAALNLLVQEHRQEQIRPGLRIVEDITHEPLPSTETWSFDPDNVDWATIPDLDSTAGKLREYLRNGLPDSIPFTYHPDVLALAGMDFDLVEAALRHPERVEVRPETGVKKYPILGFWRGDVVTILGMRTPTHPKIIAAYAVSRLDPDTWNHATTMGGGGARRREGLPKTTPALLKALARLGTELKGDDEPGARTAEVVYKGQRLGKVTIDRAPRTQVESDWQRILRKVTAIDARG